ncbi:hypothetical protein LT493_23895 [Streptomyces tricolor]|nr:hypothetical protein [Streptomyces tricolor]
MTTLLVIAKGTPAGRGQDGCAPPFSPGGGGCAAGAALADIALTAVAAAPATRRVRCWMGRPVLGAARLSKVVPQCAGGLDVRLADAFARCAGPALLIVHGTPRR